MDLFWNFLLLQCLHITFSLEGICKQIEFQCDNGECINRNYKCDGDDDCSDRSDELRCAKIKCPYSSQFRCGHSGRCIPKTWVCNGARNCADGSDETDKLCTETETTSKSKTKSTQKTTSIATTTGLKTEPTSHTQRKPAEQMTSTIPTASGTLECNEDKIICANGKCIAKDFKCDGEDDCGDGTDEQNCTKIKCPYSYQFRCGHRGRCIPRTWVCNGVSNCADGSDEADQLCSHALKILGKTTDSLPNFSLANSTRKPTSVAENCSANTFRCGKTDVCIEQSLVCDGKMDCPNNQDEPNECDIGLRSRRTHNTLLVVGLLAGICCLLLLPVVGVSVILYKCRKNQPDSTILLSGGEEGLACEANMIAVDDNYKGKTASF